MHVRRLSPSDAAVPTADNCSQLRFAKVSMRRSEVCVVGALNLATEAVAVEIGRKAQVHRDR